MIIMWKRIDGYDNYEVNELGQVRNSNTGRILKPNKNARGYWYVVLSKKCKLKTLRVHRLVALAFLPNTDDKPEVNHKDANKDNNNVENLEWVTHLENIKHAIDLGLSKPSISVVQYTIDGEYIAEYESITKATKAVNGKDINIKKVCDGIWKQHKNYIWRYKDVN